MGDLKCSIILKAKYVFSLIVLNRVINLNEDLKSSCSDICDTRSFRMILYFLPLFQEGIHLYGIKSSRC